MTPLMNKSPFKKMEGDPKNVRKCFEYDMGRVGSEEMTRYQMVLTRRFLELVVTRCGYHYRFSEVVLEKIGFQLSRKHIGICLFLPVASLNPGKKTNVISPSPMQW